MSPTASHKTLGILRYIGGENADIPWNNKIKTISPSLVAEIVTG
jgi:hypothetical protein